MSLVITIIVVIILAMIAIPASSRMPDEANYANFAEEIKNLEDGVQQTRLTNAYKGDTEEKINAGFKKVKLINAPGEFQSFDTTGVVVTGYVVDLEKIKYENTEFGHDYDKISAEELPELEFRKDDVYVYDSTGSVYYVKGTHYQDEIIHRPFADSIDGMTSSEDGPIISNIVIESGELADGTKTSAKAKIIISAFPRYGGELTVMVRDLIAEKQPDGTFTTQVSRNGVYTVVASEENGGRTVTKINVTGIIETNTLPSNLSMIVNNGNPNVTTRMVDIVVRADGASKMIIAKNNPLKPTSSDERWEDYQTSFKYDLGIEEGRVTLYAWFKNEYSNVTDQIVKATIIYDRTPPSTDAPTLTVVGPRILVESNQRDNISPDSYLKSKTQYGYRVYDGALATENDYFWITGDQVGLIGPLINGETYDVLTRTEDEVGHKSTSLVVRQKIDFDYEIKFDLNGAIGSIDTIYLAAGTSVVLPVVTIERLGYTFYGWSENADTQPEDNANIIKIGESYLPTGNEITKTLYAVWSPRTDMNYKVEHYVEKIGVMNEYELKLTETFNDGKVGDLAYAQAKTDGEFEGFVENLSHSDRVGMAEIKGDGSTVLKLYYSRAKYNLIVKGENAETVGTANDVPYQTEITISATPNEGYLFDRWVIEGVEDSSPDYASFSSENAIREQNTKFKMLGRDVVLIAKTKLEKYSIVYNLNGGEATGNNPTEYEKTTPVFTLYNPTKKGYDFVGWTGTELSEATINVTVDPSRLTKLQDREYTATYSPAEDLLTITASPTEPTNGSVRAYVSGLYTAYDDLRAEFRVGTQGAWDMYASSILVEENTVIYARLLKDGVVIDEESLVIDNIDNEAPVITDISISSNWKIGNKLLVDVTATDNVSIYGYAITSTSSTPAIEKFTSERMDLPLEEDVNYVWVRDTAGNIASQRIFAWDISEKGDKSVYAVIRKEKELIIYGTGATASYESDEVPYLDYKSNIEEIKVESEVSSIGSHVLSGMENAKNISICASLKELKENSLTKTNNYENIVIATENTNFKYENYTLYNFDKTEIYVHSRVDMTEEYTIPSTVETIMNHAFYENDNLVTVNVTSNPEVKFNAFENCSQLYQISGSIGGTSIGKEAFMDCTNLHILELSDSLESIGESTFKNTSKISVIEIPKTVNVVGKADNSINGVFEEIGILSGNIYNKGIVRYYQSCTAMYDYAHKYNTEAFFEMIDDVAPEVISLQITSPVSGTYSQGEKITFTAQFSESLKSGVGIVLPELKIKVGEGDVKTVDSATVNGDQIIYRYFIEVEDFGEIKLSSYRGTVYDLADNSANIQISTLGGSAINANTVAMLSNNDTITYHSSIQKAIDAIVGTEATVTLLKNTEENITINSNTEIELDLNEKVLTNTSANTAIVNNGNLKVYDGIIETAQTAVLTKDNSIIDLYNIQIEVTEENMTAIIGELNSDISMNYSTITGKSTLLDVSGTLQAGEVNLTTENGPAIEMKSNTTADIINGTVKTNSGYGINVLSNANVSLSNSSVESTTGTAINNEGVLEISASTTVKGAIGINSLGEVDFRDGIIEGTDSDKSAVENSGMFNIFDGKITSAAGIAVQNRIGKFFASKTSIETTGTNKDAIRNATGATIEILSGDVYSKDGYALVNSGTTTINDGAELTSDGIGVIDNKAFLSILYSTITANDGVSTAIVNTGRYEDTNNVINAKGIIGIENKNTGVVKLFGTNISVDNESMATGLLTSSTVGVSANDIQINVNVSAGNATGIKLEESSSFETERATIIATAESGIGYGIYNYKGMMTVGFKSASIRDDSPIINGSTYGYYSTNGMLNFYGGQIIGSLNNSIKGEITDKPENSFVVYTQSADREYAQLKFDEWLPTDVTLEADKTEWTSETIVLTGSAKDEGSGISRYAITNTSEMPTESEWILVDPPQNEFVITKDIEEWDVYYLHVVDNTWNYGRSNGVETKYDDMAPEIVSINPTSSEWISGDIAIEVNFSDNASGVIGYEFSKTYHEPTTTGASYQTMDATTNGSVTYTTNINETIHVYLYDQAGNVAYQEYEIDQVDNTAPTINVEFVEYGESSVKVKITVEDEDSGIGSITIDGVEKTFVEENGEKYLIHEITKSGTTVVEVKDNVLNNTIENIDTYAIIYDSVGGSGSMPNQIKLKDQEIEILANRFAKVGYTFLGWNTKNDYTGTEYQGGDKYTANENVTLYANWKDTNTPKINDVYTSSNWTPGNNVILKIDATDNIAVTGYQITTTNTLPTTWSTSNEITITLGSETYYVWVKDDTGNYTSTEIKVYDLSETTSPKTVVGLVKDLELDGEYTLSIEGQGSTKDLTSTEDKPWEEQLTDITKVEIKSGITGIGENVLSELTNVDEIKIPATVTDIALNTFAHTNNYGALNVEGSNYKVVQGMLMDAGSKNVYVASTKLTTGDIVLPSTVENIAPYAFENSIITSIYISKNIDIQEGTFKNAANLKDIITDTQIGGKSIGASAFEGCTSLQYVTLSEELETIGARAFYNTTKLTNITIGKKVTSLVGNQIFTNIGKEAGTDTGKGYVYYYESNSPMSSYAQSPATKEQATFIGIDDVLPVVSGVIINEGAEITNDNEISVEVEATDNRGIAGVFITTDASLVPTEESVSWINPAPTYTYTLPEVTGEHTIYVWVKDADGNISEAPGSDSIILAVYDFELNTEMDVIQYVDTTGKDYYEYRDKGYTLDNPDITVEVTGIDSINHEVVGDYDIDYKISYQGKYVETITKTVHVIENSWNTSETTYSNFTFVTHTTKPYAKIVGYTNTSSETTLTIPETVTYNGEEYKVIDVGNGIEAISTTDNTIQNVVLSKNVIAVSDYAFNTFKRVSSLEYSENLMTIGSYAFAGSTGIYPTLTIKENVREVKAVAFEGTVINEIIIESGVKAIGERAFYTTRGTFNNKTLNIPATIDYIGLGAFAGYKADSIIVDSANEKYTTIDNTVLTDKANTTIYQYALGNTRTEYTVPTGIQTIAGYAFAEADNLQKITLASTTATIGLEAIKNSDNLKVVENTANLTKIEREAFASTAIESFEIPVGVMIPATYEFE